MNQDFKNLITEDVDNGGQLFPRNDAALFSNNEPGKTNYEKKEERMLM